MNYFTLSTSSLVPRPEVFNLDEYDWPYSAKCPACKEHTLFEGKEICSNCGHSVRQVACPRCGIICHWRYTDNGTKQCSLYCDPRDRQKLLQEQQEKEHNRIFDVLAYPDHVQKYVNLILDFIVTSCEYSNFTYDEILNLAKKFYVMENNK